MRHDSRKIGKFQQNKRTPMSFTKGKFSLRFLSIASVFGASVASAMAPSFTERAPNIADVARLGAAPSHYRALSLNFVSMEVELARATETSPVQLNLPLSDGSNLLFDVVPVEVMAAELAAQFPRARSYRGTVFNPKNDAEANLSVRINTASGGFSAMFFGGDSVDLIEPVTIGEGQDYISYDRALLTRRPGSFVCHVGDKESIGLPVPIIKSIPVSNSPISVTGQTLRTYRLALAATGEYTAFFGGTVNGAMQNGIVPAMNRVNEIYQREFALRMILIPNNNVIIYTNGGTDPYTNDDGFAMLDENTSNLNGMIGSANYDIGHVFSTGGGGVAALNAPCGSSKAEGVTGSPAPTNDPFWVDYVAHEMGHQWGGQHTFNATTNACDGNRDAGAAYEPGSGSTIQAYAGICGGEDLQQNSDPWFHAKSLDEMQIFISSSGNSCAVTQPSGNQPPTANAGPSFTIPARTPFILTGSGTDPESRPLLYSFEQYNLGASSTPATVGVDNGTRPIIRSFSPSTNNFRIIPRLSTILGTAPAAFGETLPTTNRTLTFRLTVRDQATNGALAIGATATSDVNIVSVDTGAGFAITSQNSAVSWPAAGQQTITWAVAGTTAAPVSCANVQIALSTNLGQSFPTILRASTPNDGTETITAPLLGTTQGRIRVQCVGNIFFDINNANITIVPELFANGFE